MKIRINGLESLLVNWKDSCLFADLKIYVPGRCCLTSYFDTKVLERSCYFRTTATLCFFLSMGLEIFC